MSEAVPCWQFNLLHFQRRPIVPRCTHTETHQVRIAWTPLHVLLRSLSSPRVCGRVQQRLPGCFAYLLSFQHTRKQLAQELSMLLRSATQQWLAAVTLPLFQIICLAAVAWLFYCSKFAIQLPLHCSPAFNDPLQAFIEAPICILNQVLDIVIHLRLSHTSMSISQSMYINFQNHATVLSALIEYVSYQNFLHVTRRCPEIISRDLQTRPSSSVRSRLGASELSL